MKKNLSIAVFLLAVAAVAIGVGSYNVWEKVQTLPSNSVRTIRDAVAKHDEGTFNILVDTDAVLDTAATEILTAYINENVNPLTYSTLEVVNRYQALRADFLAEGKAAINDYVETGHANISGDTEIGRWLKDSGVDSCVLKTYSKPVVGEGIGRTKMYFYNEALKFSFELKVTMQKINETDWRVIAAEGFDGYFSGVERAKKIRLDSLNAPIKDQIAETFMMKGFKAVVTEGDEYGFSKTLKLSLDADIASNKPLYRVSGRVLIDGRDGKQGITPFTIDMTNKLQGQQTIDVNKVLNPFVRQDADIMRHGLRKSDIHIEITEIDYLDGSSLKQIDALPE